MTPEPLPEAHRKCPLLAPPALQVSPAPEVPPGASSLSLWTLDQGCRHPGPRARAGNHTASSEPLKPLSGRKLPTTLSVSGLWPPRSLYGPFTVLGPGFRQRRPLCGKVAPGKGQPVGCGPRDPPSLGAGLGLPVAGPGQAVVIPDLAQTPHFQARA